jgi:glycosyltransferase involved in cell wall biosynthesis
MTKLWIVTEVFFPEETATAYILTKIANHLADEIDVNVICGPASYEGKDSNQGTGTLDERVKILRVSGTVFGKNRLISRVFRFLSMTWKLTREFKKRVADGDEVLVVTNPAPILLSIARLRSRKTFRLSLLVHDVFPENTIPAGIIKSEKSLFYRFLKSLFDRAYAKADKLIVLGRDMENVVTRKIGEGSENKTVIIENWADLENVNPEQRVDDGKIVLQYAGNLGRVQGLMELLKCVKDSSNDLIEMSFLGGGAVEKELKNFVEINKMDNVHFYGNYKRNEQNKILNSCDLAIVTLAEGMYGLGVPSKTYNILAAGKPILYIGDDKSEVALMIKENGIGYVFKPNEIDKVTLFLRELSAERKSELLQMGIKARHLAEDSYSEKEILDKYLDIL